MRHYELINEIKGNYPNILAAITKDCQPFLKRIGDDIGNYPLYRGMEEDVKPIVRKKVRLDSRKPMSSAKIKHDRYNHFFEEMFGEPFRNSLFVTGRKDTAQHYGAAFVVFPIGDFDWVWSTEVNDMAIDIRWPSMGGHVNVPPSQEAVDRALGDANYTINSNLKGAILSGNEIMIRCPEYYAISIPVFEGIT